MHTAQKPTLMTQTQDCLTVANKNKADWSIGRKLVLGFTIWLVAGIALIGLNCTVQPFFTVRRKPMENNDASCSHG